jgi:hypothetical protein
MHAVLTQEDVKLAEWLRNVFAGSARTAAPELDTRRAITVGRPLRLKRAAP